MIRSKPRAAGAGLLFLVVQATLAQMPPGAAEYRKGDYARAFPVLMEQAEYGDPVAQFLVGQSYDLGRGVERNVQTAQPWFRKARRPELPQRLSEPAGQGDPLAQAVLGICHQYGIGMAPHPEQAASWYRKAAQQGYPDAQVNLGAMLQSEGAGEAEMAEGFRWYEAAAETGNLMAIYNVGVAYDRAEGVEQDLGEAAKHFQIAADRGYPGAQFNLGVAYLEGKGVEQDEPRAVKLFGAAAEEGYVPAQFNLALSFFLGRGVAKSPSDCYFWTSLATLGGHAQAPRLQSDCGKQLDRDGLKAAKARVARITGGAR